jgi:hypothetical protein
VDGLENALETVAFFRVEHLDESDAALQVGAEVR